MNLRRTQRSVATAVSQIVAETMEEMDLKMPEATDDLEVIRRKYHEAAEQMPAS